MLHRLVCAFVTYSILLSPAAAATADSALQPTKPWIVEYADANCSAQRAYATPTGEITLVILPSPIGETLEFMLIDKQAGPTLAEEQKGALDFGSGPIKAWYLRYGTKDGTYGVRQFRISKADIAQARAAKSVTFHLNRNDDEQFSLQSMPALLDGLQKCTDDLQHYWNMTAAEQPLIKVPARGDLRNLFKSDDYPSEAMFRYQEGKAIFLLLVNEKGKVAACYLKEQSGIPALDGRGCQIFMERASFSPAKGLDGRPMRSSVETPPIVWGLR